MVQADDLLTKGIASIAAGGLHDWLLASLTTGADEHEHLNLVTRGSGGLDGLKRAFKSDVAQVGFANIESKTVIVFYMTTHALEESKIRQNQQRIRAFFPVRQRKHDLFFTDDVE